MGALLERADVAYTAQLPDTVRFAERDGYTWVMNFGLTPVDVDAPADTTWHVGDSEEYLWGGGFREESNYVGTAGDVSTDTIEQYIERTEHV